MAKEVLPKTSKTWHLPEFSWSWLSIPSLLVAWMLVATQFPSYILPQVWEVAAEAYEWTADGSLLPHLWASFIEEVGGFGAAIIISIIAGFMAGFYKPFREYIVPLNGLFMAIPPIAWAPLMLIIFGIGYTTIVVVIFISAVNPMILTIMEGVLTIQGSEVRAARVLGANRWQLFRYVYLPASLPFVTAALRIGFSQAWRALVAAEMIGATQGLGWMVSMGGEIGNSRQVLLGIVLIGGVSWLFERIFFRRIEKRYEIWRLA
jgi:NitT/TauT family transport system permease protein/taurine transport system permease protein